MALDRVVAMVAPLVGAACLTGGLVVAHLKGVAVAVIAYVLLTVGVLAILAGFIGGEHYGERTMGTSHARVLGFQMVELVSTFLAVSTIYLAVTHF